MILEQQLVNGKTRLQSMELVIYENVGLKTVNEAAHLIVWLCEIEVRVQQLAGRLPTDLG
jgi:hypothetical protein